MEDNSSSVAQNNARDAKSSVEGSGYVGKMEAACRLVLADSEAAADIPECLQRWNAADDAFADAVTATTVLRLLDDRLDLLDALKRLVSKYGYEDDNVTPKDWNEYVQARAAIARATGEASPADTASPAAGNDGEREEP